MDVKNVNQPELEQPRLAVGDTVTIEQVDWTVAELVNDKIVLYRERVDGRSQTMEVTEEELRDLLSR
jgi:hypothetical protein